MASNIYIKFPAKTTAESDYTLCFMWTRGTEDKRGHDFPLAVKEASNKEINM